MGPQGPHIFFRGALCVLYFKGCVSLKSFIIISDFSVCVYLKRSRVPWSGPWVHSSPPGPHQNHNCVQSTLFVKRFYRFGVVGSALVQVDSPCRVRTTRIRRSETGRGRGSSVLSSPELRSVKPGEDPLRPGSTGWGAPGGAQVPRRAS